MFTKNLILKLISNVKFKHNLNFPNSIKNFNKNIDNEEGLATIETVALLSIFVFLMSSAIGFWGAIHAGTLSAIGARAYAFETFRNRSHLSQFRDNSALDRNINYIEENWQMRLHRVVERGGHTNTGTVAEKLTISFNDYNIETDNLNSSKEYHNRLIDEPAGRGPASSGSNSEKDNTIWLQVGYGYCLTFECGDEN